MLTHELRIGNYLHFEAFKKDVYDPLMVSKVSAISENEIFFGRIKVSNLQKVKPILLDDEWLIKLGFVKSDRFWINNEIRIYVSPVEEYDYYLDYNDRQHSVSYVHRLQNIYLDLTGEILTIKNTTTNN